MSEYLLPTQREAPADAEALSHILGVRAGLVRQLGTGLWSWMPAGWAVHQRVVQIVREEMNAIGGLELLMPVIHPRELWKRTGRDQIDELFKFEDRKGSELVLAMTHEESVTFHVSTMVRSYRDLPLLLYHFQTKGRDEPRPRAGILRTREFIMKDAYSFDRDDEGLDVSYEKFRGAYAKAFDRTGLEWFECASDVGMMGGTAAHEYMAPCPAGENNVVLAPGYAANIEVATADPQPVDLPAGLPAPELVSTPGMTTVDQVAGHFGVPAGALLKAFPVATDSGKFVLVIVRGDHRVNEIKLQNSLGEPFRPASEDWIASHLGPPGFIGPVGCEVPILLDAAVGPGSYIAGSNQPEAHLRGVEPGRDFSFEVADVRAVVPGDTIGGTVVRIEAAIEVGNIFKLGTRYSKPLGATYSDESGKDQLIVMGSYGIGPARITAAAIEQSADEHGISWPRALSPYQVHLVSAGKAGSDERAASDALYEELSAAGIEVLYDERDMGPGQKFAEAELLGCPLRLTVGRRSLESGTIEAQGRRGRVELPGVALGDGAVAGVEALLRDLP